MEKLKLDINKYKQKDTKLCATEWQQYAKDTCQDFGVIHPYDKIVFKYAKSNLTFLKAQVTNLQESAAYKGEDTKTYGRLLTYKLNLHKKKPTTKTYAPLCLRRCTRCGNQITGNQRWRATSYTMNGKVKTDFYHKANCVQSVDNSQYQALDNF